MRTRIEIDDRLMAEAQRVSGLTTRKQTVEEALRLNKRDALGGRRRDHASRVPCGFMVKKARLSLADIKKRGTSRDRSKIAATTAADIRRHRIEDGNKNTVPPADRLQPRPATIRHRLGMTQRQFAAAIGVPLATLRNWEQSRAEPDPAARALPRILAREPAAARRALGKSKAA